MKAKNREFKVFPVRQPWAFCINQRMQKILNNDEGFDSEYVNKWLALWCSHADTDTTAGIPLNFPSNQELRKQCGKILGVVRFGGVVPKDEAYEIDPNFTDKPEDCKYHILVNNAEPLMVPQAYDYSSEMRFPDHAVSMKSLNIQLQELVEKAEREVNQRGFESSSDNWDSQDESDEEMEDLADKEETLETKETEDARMNATDLRMFQNLDDYKSERLEERRAMAHAMGTLTPDQMLRFEEASRSKIDQKLVKKVMSAVLGIPEKDLRRDVVICMSGISKVFLEEIIEESLKAQISQPDWNPKREYHPIQPSHIREALRRLKQQGKYKDFL